MNHDSRSFEDDLSSLKADVAVIRSNIVTKEHLQKFRIEMEGEIQGLRTELRGDKQSLRSDLGELRLEIEKFRTEIQKARAEFYEILNAQTWKMYWFGVAFVTAVYLLTKAGY